MKLKLAISGGWRASLQDDAARVLLCLFRCSSEMVKFYME